ncbi:YbdD/YjiX family protein [Nocardia sp. NPDC020380]|uniref:YbdD/YjiX family protein n=1 Tax=Nocardia sp. NPDC020380 TaxID=3364309 RepID=UPI0037A3F3D2
MRSAGRTLFRALRAVIWWFNSILGGNDYRRYVEHLRRRHPGSHIPSEREYWRERHAAAAKNPANRCC